MKINRAGFEFMKARLIISTIGLYIISGIVFYQAAYDAEYFNLTNGNSYWWNWRFKMGIGFCIAGSFLLAFYLYGINKLKRKK